MIHVFTDVCSLAALIVELKPLEDSLNTPTQFIGVSQPSYDLFTSQMNRPVPGDVRFHLKGREVVVVVNNSAGKGFTIYA